MGAIFVERIKRLSFQPFTLQSRDSLIRVFSHSQSKNSFNKCLQSFHHVSKSAAGLKSIHIPVKDCLKHGSSLFFFIM